MIAPDPALADPRAAATRTGPASPEAPERRPGRGGPDFEKVVAERPARRRDAPAAPDPAGGPTAEAAAATVAATPAATSLAAPVVATSLAAPGPAVVPAPPAEPAAPPVEAAAPELSALPAAQPATPPGPGPLPQPQAEAATVPPPPVPSASPPSDPAPDLMPPPTTAEKATPVAPPAAPPSAAVTAVVPPEGATPQGAMPAGTPPVDPDAPPTSDTAPARHEPAAPSPAATAPSVPVVPAAQPAQPAIAALEAPPPSWSLAPDPAAAPHRSEPQAALPPPTVAAGSPQAVVAQVALAVGKTRDRHVEIRLDPPELGRVQIHLTEADGRLQALVLADRPETQDLLRRHADALQRDLEGAGYAGVELAFAAGGEARPERRPPAPPRALALALDGVAPDPGPAAPASRPRAGGLDIRL